MSLVEKVTEATKLVMPEHLNPAGNLFGGTLMSWLDKTSAILAMQYTGLNCVTVAVDGLAFKKPVYLGEVVRLKAIVIKEGRTSLTVKVKAEARKATDPNSSYAEVCDSTFKFVAIDQNGKPTPNWKCRRLAGGGFKEV